jgi:hypothetical protein
VSEGASDLLTSVFAACDLLSADLFSAVLGGAVGLAAPGAGNGAFVVEASCDGVVAGCDVDAGCEIGSAADAASA